MSISFSTKAETLKKLAGFVKTAKVLPQIGLTVQQWVASHEAAFNAIKSVDWSGLPLIVRSSAINEDCFDQSMAGKYLSVLNIVGKKQLAAAIEEVIESYEDQNELNQILIQPMLKDVMISGVAFSRDPNTGGYYIVINYDDTTGTTHSVTSGLSNDIKTFYYFKSAPQLPEGHLAKVIALVKELETIFQNNSLDIEFAITTDGSLYLLQVRPLNIKVLTVLDEKSQLKALDGIYRKICQLNCRHPYLNGSRTIFGVMPDWNPAEIIGIRPRPLALSLYKEIITDNIWAYQRDNYGYKNLRSFPLLVSFAGQPYIDVRVDFNSFIPADIEEDLAERLVNFYIKKLIEFPANHDKVEFEIIYTCYTIDLPERLITLSQNGFSKEECSSLADSLRRLTNRIIGESGLWRKDIEKIAQLESRCKTILESSMDKVSQIYWLLEDCKRYGTLPFAGLARAAFIAVQLLKSLVNIGILTQSEYNCFMQSLNTVSSNLAQDFQNLSRGAFLRKYGHLRPGTYDILSPRYDEAPDRYFDWDVSKKTINSHEKSFAISLEQMNQIKSALVEHELEYDVLGLFNFIKGAIEGREYAKFIFTQSLSDILLLCGQFAEENGYSVEQCSYSDINCFKQLYASSDSIQETLGKSIEEGQKHYAFTTQVILPPLITKPEDVWMFHQPSSEPNYITLKSKVGDVCFPKRDLGKMKDNILLIESADPGYDWVFSHNIGGLITKYGGANSHMAIRAAELGIPAVIGAGELFFEKWAKAITLELNCASRQVRVLK